MKKILVFLFVLAIIANVNGQKKIMDQQAYHFWNKIQGTMLSNEGDWLAYQLVPGKGDKTLKLVNNKSQEVYSFDRVEQSQFTEDGEFIVFTVSAAQDSVIALRRKKLDDKKLPKDSLVIFNLSSLTKTVIPNVKTFKMPNKWSGTIAYQATIEISEQKDSTSKMKAEERFFIHDLSNHKVDTLLKVDEYLFVLESEQLVYVRSGSDSSAFAGVFHYDAQTGLQSTLIEQIGKYSKVSAAEDGNFISFLADQDTTKRRIRPYDLYLWSNHGKNLEKVVGSADRLSSEEWYLSDKASPSFSKNGARLFFGIAPHPVLEDSLVLKEEKVNVEVWTTEDPMLYTMQEIQKKRLENKTFQVYFDIENRSFHPLENETYDRITRSVKGNGRYFMATNNQSYQKEITWKGSSLTDVYLIDAENGEEWMVARGMKGNPSFSPAGRYLYWYDSSQEDWLIYNIAERKNVNLTSTTDISFANELHDQPTEARSYRSAGWTENDSDFLINDRYDIWSFDPLENRIPTKLTNNRISKISSRVIKVDREKDYVEEKALVYIFDEKTKNSGYANLNTRTGESEVIEIGPFSYGRSIVKAKEDNALVFTKQSFEVFPDLIITDETFKEQRVVTEANPQQSEYTWGSIELFEWEDYDGQAVQGLLVKPEDFDPRKKYPVIVNFYERSSDGLFRHRAPEPHRSTINYSYYANKGYVIFNPDISYKIGAPGESCYNAVMSGVEALAKNQFVDKQRIGLQGHSWGGYQIAYLLNKTDKFKCAESGAPVVNMISA